MTRLPPPIEGLHLAAPSLPRALAPRRRWPSPVWLVPVLAVAVTAWLGLRALRDRGPTVTITFATAEGLEPRRTTIRYKSVEIGVVEAIELLDDRSGVRVTARLSRSAQPLLVEDARFWVVRPRVSMGGVSGIGTLITGAHIGFEAGASTRPRHAFAGLETPPSDQPGRQGRRYLLRGDNIGSLDVGSPVYLRRFQVGQVTRVGLDPGGDGVVLEVFVDAPHHQHVTAGTRFWNASGVDLTVSSRGLKLDTQSLASVLLGGIAFETPGPTPAAPAPAGAEFRLWAAREVAMRNPGASTDRYVLVFERPVRGLTAGAPVDLLGIDVGEVSAVDLELDARRGTSRTVVTIEVHPSRILVRDDAGVVRPAEESAPLLARLVQRGLRAQLRADNLLTGQRSVALDVVPGAGPARLEGERLSGQLPTFEGGPADLREGLGRLVAKMEKLPLEPLLGEGTQAARELRATLASTGKLVERVDGELVPQMSALVARTSETMGSVERSLSSEGPLQHELRGTLRDLGNAGQALRSLAEYLERHPESLVRGKREDRR